MVRVKIHLVRNPKALSSKPFVAKIEGDEIQFIRPVIPEYAKNGTFVGGEYELEPGKYYIVRTDESSHKHSRQTYTLCYFDGRELKEVAWIARRDGNLEFSNEELKDVYARIKAGGQNNVIVRTLIEYARLHAQKNEVDVEQLIRNEITKFVEELERRYGVKINISIEVIKR